VTRPGGRGEPVVASQARRNLPSASGDVAVSPADATGNSGDIATYPTLTLVDITMTGTFQMKNDYLHTERNIGPAGIANCNKGLTMLKWDDGGTHRGTWFSQDCTEGVATASGYQGVIGRVWAERSAIPPSCDAEGHCDTFSGGPISVTVTPRAGTLSLTCQPVDLTYGPFTADCMVTASIDARYVTELSVVWTDDTGTTPFQSCGLGSRCYLGGRNRTGTVLAVAKVNGEPRSARVRVQYRCVTGDSVVDGSQERRQHLLDQWAAGGDRDSLLTFTIDGGHGSEVSFG